MANFAKIMLVSPNNAFFHKRKEIRRTGSTGQQERHIGHFGKYHNTLCLSLQICISIVSSFSWDLKWPQEKTKTMLMQNLGAKTKSIMVFSELAYLELIA